MKDERTAANVLRPLCVNDVSSLYDVIRCIKMPLRADVSFPSGSASKRQAYYVFITTMQVFIANTTQLLSSAFTDKNSQYFEGIYMPGTFLNRDLTCDCAV